MTEDADVEAASKSGMMIGREALELLDAQGEFTYHGSDLLLEELQPRQAYTFDHVLGQRVPDGAPAVCTTPNIDQAIFRAIVSRHRDEQRGQRYFSAWAGGDTGIQFFALRDTLEYLQHNDVVGYVYVFRRALFLPYRGEFRTAVSVRPQYVVTVNDHDLPANVEFFQTIGEAQAAHQTARQT